MADQMQNHHNPIIGTFLTLVSWCTVIITLQSLDIYLRIACSLVALVTGILGGINWYWSIKKNKRQAKRDIPF